MTTNKRYTGSMELLAPAGSFDSLVAAVNAGADAVYMGGQKFGARAYADNPDEDGLRRALDYVHERGKSLFLTVNTLMKQRELEDELAPFLAPLYEQGLDGVIVQDLGVLKRLGEWFPELPLHASTQTTLCNSESGRLLKGLGVSRLVLPREMSLSEISRIHRETGMDLEVFVHGALCYCYSGQCLMSSFLGGRSGNRGRCAQPCRLEYQGGRLLNMKDLCSLELLPRIREAGAMSLKIEGRMKSPVYTAGVVSIYRKYLDLLDEKGEESFRVRPEDLKQLSHLFDRGGFTDGYFTRHNGNMVLTGNSSGRISLSEAEEKELSNRFCGERELPVEGFVRVVEGEELSLSLDCAGVQLVKKGAVVQTASARPLSAADVEKQLRKMGGSGFYWTELKLQTEGNPFVPVSSLNALRRSALEELHGELLKSYRRVTPERKEEKGAAAAGCAYGSVSLTVSLEDVRLLDTVLTYPLVSHIYLPADYLEPKVIAGLAEKIHAAGKSCVLALPYVFRHEAKQHFLENQEAYRSCGIDGWLIRSLDEAGFLAEQGFPGERIFDSGVYAWNTAAAEVLRTMGADRLVLSPEPHEKDLKVLEQQPLPLEMQIYGRIPMMVSAQCIRKTAGRCLKEQGKPALSRVEWQPLTDRTGAVMPAELRCRYCCNVIYNPVPLWLMDQKLPRADRLRISFTNESAEEMKTVLSAAQDGFTREPARLAPPQGMDFTRGHFKKGVQ